VTQEQHTNTLGALILHHTITALLLSGALALGIWGFLTYKKGGFTYAQAPVEKGSTHRYLIASQEAKLKLAAETYTRINQTPPLETSVLVDAGLILEDDLHYPSHNVTYTLHVDGKDIKITSSVNIPSTKTTETIDPVE